MAAGEVFPFSCVGMLESPSPSLQNSIKFSYSGSYFSALCDFGVVQVCQLKGKLEGLVEATKGAFQKSELAGQTRHFGNEIGFFQEVLLQNHILCA